MIVVLISTHKESNRMSEAKSGDTVKVHYIGTLKDGDVFDNSYDRGSPLEFKIGEGQLIPGFENGIVGMNAGDKKKIQINADDAYGAHHPELVVEMTRDQLPEGLEPQVGAQYQVEDPEGNALLVTVKDVTDEHVTLDGNHPLAGHNLTFEVELVEIA